MKQTNFENAIEVIGQGIEDLFLPEDPENDEVRKNINTLINCAEEGYNLVQWPDSQEYMEEEWFDEEAIFCVGSEDKTGSSAYFIPIKRIV